MSGRSRLMLLNAFLGAAANVGLNLWLVPAYGVLGAAWAALASVVFFRGLGLVQALWLERVHPWSSGLGKALLAAAVALGATLGLREALDPLSLPLVLFLGAGQLVIYLAGLILLGLGAEERQILSRIPGLRWLGREQHLV